MIASLKELAVLKADDTSIGDEAVAEIAAKCPNFREISFVRNIVWCFAD